MEDGTIYDVHRGIIGGVRYLGSATTLERVQLQITNGEQLPSFASAPLVQLRRDSELQLLGGELGDMAHDHIGGR
jgi:hypothetical protein